MVSVLLRRQLSVWVAELFVGGSSLYVGELLFGVMEYE